MHDPVRAKCPFASVTEAPQHVLSTKQQETEGLLDYVKRFKQQQDILKSHMGMRFLDEFMGHLPECEASTHTNTKWQHAGTGGGNWTILVQDLQLWATRVAMLALEVTLT